MRGKLMLVLMLLVLALAGCGGGPKADVPIFMTGPNGIPAEVGDKLQTALQTKIGAEPTVSIVTSPIFSMEKLIVEIAGAENGIIILPAEQFKALGQQGGYVSLDSVARMEDFPGGVLELPADSKDSSSKKEKHLYGLPLEETKWFTELKLNGKDLVAFVPANAKNQDKVMQVMKIIAQKR